MNLRASRSLGFLVLAAVAALFVARGAERAPAAGLSITASNMTSLLTFGYQGTGDGGFLGAYGVAVDPVTGAVYVVDNGHGQVEKFDAGGNFLTSFGAGELVTPWYVAVDPATGDVYVTDTYNRRVVKYDSTGNQLLTFGTNGTGDGEFGDPLGIAVDPSDGDVYVVDATNHRVEKFDSGGGYLGQFDPQAHPFGNAYDVAVDSAGVVYVSDVLNAGTGNWIARFDSSGGYLGYFGSTGSGDGQFQLPFGVAVDSDAQIVYVDDFGHGRMEMFDTSGGFLGAFASGLSESRGVAVDPVTGDIYVTDGSTVQKWGQSRNWTQTSLSCAPASIRVGDTTTCHVTVADIAGSGQATPTGTVSFNAWTSGSTFSGGGSCTLQPTTPDYHASCAVTYTPTRIGSGTHWIDVSYRGSTLHTGSHTSRPAVTVNPADAPTISSFAPVFGGHGTSVAITGSNFTGTTAVVFGGTAAQSYTVASDTEVDAVVGTGSSGPVAVTTAVGTATSSGSFAFFAAPTIASFTPPGGGVHTTVTVAGTNLTGTTGVRLHGVSAVFSVVSTTQLTFTVPAGATSGTITVTGPGGTATSGGSFIVSAPPTITSISPVSGPVGTTVTITGTNLGGTIGIRIGSVITVPTSVSPTQVVFTVPPGAATGRVKILSPAGAAQSPGDFTIAG